MTISDPLLEAKAILERTLRSVYTVSASERAGVLAVDGRLDSYRFVRDGRESGLELATRVLKVVR
jgi:hypothetical protein